MLAGKNHPSRMAHRSFKSTNKSIVVHKRPNVTGNISISLLYEQVNQYNLVITGAGRYKT